MTAEPAGGLFLTNAAGVPGSVRILGDEVAAVGHDVRPAPRDSVADLAGYVLLPGLAEPHVHLDKVFTASRAEPVTPDLAGAIAAWYDLRGELSEADFTARARRAAAGYLASGTTAIRAHIDVSPVLGTIPVAAVRTVGDELAGMIDVEIVASAACPVTGRPAGKTSPRCATRSTRAPTWSAARRGSTRIPPLPAICCSASPRRPACRSTCMSTRPPPQPPTPSA